MTNSCINRKHYQKIRSIHKPKKNKIQGGAKRTHVFESACDFVLWGYLKSKVYVRKPRTVDDLKVSIRQEIATVPQEMLVNVMQNFEGGSGRVYGKKDAIFPI